MNCMLPKRVILGVLLAPVAGCGSMADSEYEGAALMRINGSIISNETTLPSMGVALMWQISPNLEGCTAVTDSVSRVTTEGAFPAAFHLVITQPPPAGAFIGDSPVAEAYVAALDDANRPYGYAANPGRVVYKVIYSRVAIAPNSPESVRSGGTELRASYQLAFWDLSTSMPTLQVVDGSDSVNIEILTPSAAPLQPVCRPMPPSTTSTSNPPPAAN